MKMPNKSDDRAAFIENFIKRYEAAGKKLPLLTLAEFFDGNTEEDSLVFRS